MDVKSRRSKLYNSLNPRKKKRVKSGINFVQFLHLLPNITMLSYHFTPFLFLHIFFHSQTCEQNFRENVYSFSLVKFRFQTRARRRRLKWHWTTSNTSSDIRWLWWLVKKWIIFVLCQSTQPTLVYFPSY